MGSRECRYLAVIPARKGSKGLRNKNLRLIGMKPMIQYTIEAAQGSLRLDSTVLTTDDVSILRLAKRLKVEYLLRRPNYLATDMARTTDVVRHALLWIKSHVGIVPENIVLLQPTSPFRTRSDVDAVIDAFEGCKSSSIMSVCEVSQHPAECVSLREDGSARFLAVRGETTFRRQQYNAFYFVDGAIYICRTKTFLKTGTFFHRDTKVHILPRSHCIDIDDIFGLSIARAMMAFAEHTYPHILNL